MDVGLKIVTGRNVALRFDAVPEQARENLRDVIADATSRLAEMVRAKVPKRTGKLAGEIKSRTVEGPHNVTGIVEVAGMSRRDFGKAGALEYGSHVQEKVKAHEMRLAHMFGAPMDEVKVAVAAHSRKLNLPARDYLRGPEAEISSEVLASMEEAVERAVGK